MSTVSGNPEFINKLSLYLDNELDVKQEQNLLQEIESNPQYSAIHHKEQAFKHFLKKSVSHRKASPEVLDKLKSKITFYSPVL